MLVRMTARDEEMRRAVINKDYPLLVEVKQQPARNKKQLIQPQTLSFLCLFRTELMQVILRGDSTMLEDMRTRDAEMKEFLSNVPAFR